MYPGRAGSSLWMRLAVVLEIRKNELSVAVVQTAYHSDPRYQYKGTKKTVVQHSHRTVKVHPSLWSAYARLALRENGFGESVDRADAVRREEVVASLFSETPNIVELARELQTSPLRAEDIRVNGTNLPDKITVGHIGQPLPYSEGSGFGRPATGVAEAASHFLAATPGRDKFLERLENDPVAKRSCPYAVAAMLEDEQQMQHTVLDAPTE